MKSVIYLYSQEFLFDIINQILFEYKILPLNSDELNNHNFKNNNTLLVLKNDSAKEIKKSFFSNTNVVVFLPNKQNLSIDEKSYNAHFISRSSTKKFLDEINTFFISKILVLKNIEIMNEKISNINSGESLLLTSLEKKILVVLFENKKIKRDYFLEEILKIKKNIETKTIESHLTRIRKKLFSIKSEVQIKSKEDFIYLDS